MDAFGVSIECETSLAFDIMLCTEARLLLMEERDDFDNNVYEIVLGTSRSYCRAN